MNSSFLRLNLNDVSKGIVVAVLVAVVGALQQSLQGNGLDFASYNWSSILDVAWKAGVAYLSKNLLTDSKGKFGGVV